MNEIQYLQSAAVRGMAEYLMEDTESTMEEALGVLAESRTLSKLLDDETGLYISAPAHVYEYLKEELSGDAKPRGEAPSQAKS